MTFMRMYHSIRLLLIRGDHKKAEYLRRHHVFAGIGENCKWGPWMVPIYPELIKLHDNVCVHKTALLIPHDMINKWLKKCRPEIDFGSSEVIGPIEIQDNVYISINAIIMPNVEIGKNCIIGAGCIVSNDVPENSIVSGNPATVIGNFNTYAALRKMKSANNPVFRNQYLPEKIANEAWEKFHIQRRKHCTNLENNK